MLRLYQKRGLRQYLYSGHYMREKTRGGKNGGRKEHETMRGKKEI